MRKKLSRFGAESLRGFQKGMVELPRRLGYHQYHLKECPDKNKRDLRFIVRAKDRYQQGAEGRCRHVSKKINEGLRDLGTGRVCSAENTDWDATKHERKNPVKTIRTEIKRRLNSDN